MLTNSHNFFEEEKFKQKTRSNILYCAIFLLELIAYILIIKIEGSKGDALGFFTLNTCFMAITIASVKLVPANRDGSIRLFKFGTLGFTLYTIMFDIVYWATTQGGGGTMAEILSKICLYTRVMIPLALIIWQAKEIFLLFKNKRNKNDEIDNIKEHGNDGFF